MREFKSDSLLAMSGTRRSGARARLVAAVSIGLLGLPAQGAAPVIGYHDVSDPVKTLGWACAGGTAPLRVRLYAELPSGLTLLATEVADKRREDLRSVCGGDPAHAFRFSDFAQTVAGQNLYQRSDAVALHVMVETADGLQPLPGTPQNVSFAPVGIRDAGLMRGAWRTDYLQPTEGTLEAPLLLGDCTYSWPSSDGFPTFSGGGYSTGPCTHDTIIWNTSNSGKSDNFAAGEPYWVAIANIEPALGNPLCVSGPPNKSRVIRVPGSGELFGLIALPDTEAGRPERRKMHLVLNSFRLDECRRFSYAIPWLSFGAQADRGNGGVLTYLNGGSSATLRFGATLMDIADKRPEFFGVTSPGEKRYSEATVWIEAVWGGKKRWVFIELLPDIRASATPDKGTVDVHVRFNWPMVNSFLYPGGDYVFKSATVLSSQCQSDGVAIPTMDRNATYVDAATRDRSRVDYAIPLQALFDCLNRIGAWGAEPMPAYRVPVTGVHFTVEQVDLIYRDGVFAGKTLPNAVWWAIDSVDLQ